MGPSRPLFDYFRPFLINFSIIQIEKSIDGVLGIGTHGCRMVGADNTTELWQLPGKKPFLKKPFLHVNPTRSCMVKLMLKDLPQPTVGLHHTVFNL